MPLEVKFEFTCKFNVEFFSRAEQASHTMADSKLYFLVATIQLTETSQQGPRNSGHQAGRGARRSLSSEQEVW